jgi:hypothetical protein
MDIATGDDSRGEFIAGFTSAAAQTGKTEIRVLVPLVAGLRPV